MVRASVDVTNLPTRLMEEVTARAEDSQHRVFDLPVEAVGRVKNLTWMSKVTVRLPDELSGAGDINVAVTVRGAESNKSTLRVE